MIIISILRKLIEFKKAGCSIPIIIIRHLYYRLHKKNIFCHHRVTIKGLKNIATHGELQVGTSYVGFMHTSDRTLLNIGGKLIINSNFSIGRGCRFDIGGNAVCSFDGGYINANSVVIIMHGLKVGKNVAISWGCEFLDEYFHEIQYSGKKNKDPIIEIGDNVWIGSGAKILQGVKIGSGNVIAANSVLTKSFPESNLLIGGNPAKIIKKDIKWK